MRFCPLNLHVLGFSQKNEGRDFVFAGVSECAVCDRRDCDGGIGGVRLRVRAEGLC